MAWHQDGWTHWDSPDLDGGTHGFNFMAQLYGCNSANGLWVAQDTGGAIKGSNRFDTFWGPGEEAAAQPGRHR